MTKRKPKVVVYRRKQNRGTNYRKRLRLLLGQHDRLVVRLTNTSVIAQIVEYHRDGDKIVVGVNSTALRKLGWKYSCKNIPAAYLTGVLIGTRAIEAGRSTAIFDSGFRGEFKGGRLYAVLKGALDAGLNVPHGENIFPSDERVEGHHIQNYGAFSKGKESSQFSQYLKTNAVPEKIVQSVQETKSKMMKE